MRCGCVAANSRLIAAPSDEAKIADRFDAAASSTTRKSPILVSSVVVPLTRSDIPVPLLSKRISREKEAYRRSAGANDSRLRQRSTWMNRGTKTRSNGPSPVTWYAMKHHRFVHSACPDA